MNTQHISAILFQLDPMNTCCIENDLYDEYADVAELISSGTAVKTAFEQRFWEDCLSPQVIETITAAIV